MFCLPQSTAACEPPVARQREPGEAAPALARGDLGRELRARIVEGGLQLARGRAQPLSEPATATQSVLERAGRHGDLVAQLPALALAERAVVARARQGSSAVQTFVPCGPRYSFGDAPVSPATGFIVEATIAA